MEIVLRQATEDDVTELATLNKRLVVDQGSRNPYTASEYEGRFRDWLRGDEWNVDIFGNSEGVTLGYAVHTVQQDYYYPDQEVVYLRQFYIDRPMRRRGIGTAAYELLAKERFGGSRGCGGCSCNQSRRPEVLGPSWVYTLFHFDEEALDFCEEHMTVCPFCDIADKSASAVIVWEDSDIVAFLDTRPIRKGHCLIIPKRHIESFEEMPSDLAARIMALGQRLAKRMKTIYKVDRVAFLFAGSDVPHTHAHVFPMHEKMDITSARYILSPENLQFGSSHLRVDEESLVEVESELRLD